MLIVIFLLPEVSAQRFETVHYVSNTKSIYFFYPKINHATASVIRILNTCAIKNTAAGFFDSLLKISAKRVSKPMQVKANANQNV